MNSRTVLVWLVFMSLLVLPGCGGYSNENIPEVVVTPEMLTKMQEEEAARMEQYRQIAAERGMRADAVVPEGGPMGIAVQKRREAIEKRAAARRR